MDTIADTPEFLAGVMTELADGKQINLFFFNQAFIFLPITICRKIKHLVEPEIPRPDFGHVTKIFKYYKSHGVRRYKFYFPKMDRTFLGQRIAACRTYIYHL
jgi:hypothetical protein